MAQPLLPAFLIVQLLYTVTSVSILSLWVPDIVENGTESSAVLDCVYNFTEEDKDSLEVLWYWRHGLQPIYQWMPPSTPQILAKKFIPHLETEFHVTEDNYTRHRALNLVNLDTSLSGVYSCRVSSNLGDSFQSKVMTIYSKPRKSEFLVSRTKNGKANLTCLTREVYPQPQIRLLRITEWGTLQDLSRWSKTVTSWYNGSFHQRTHIILPVYKPGLVQTTPYVRSAEMVQCEVTIPQTTYKKILYQNWTYGNVLNNSGSSPKLPLSWLLLFYPASHVVL